MTDANTKVATAILKEVPLGQVRSFVASMTADAGGGGCGGGCGLGCANAIDRASHLLDPADLKSAAANKAGLLKAIQAQASEHVTKLAG